MTYKQKIETIKALNPSEWMRVRKETEDALSKSQAVFCVCGKLATGLHESYCRKFGQLVDKKTLQNIKTILA